MKRILSLILCLSITVITFGQDWQSISQKINSDKAFNNADAVVLLDSTGVVIDQNGSGKFKIHKVVKVQNVKGRLRYRTLVYDYDPLTAFAKYENVTIIKKDGSKKNIDVNKACDYIAPAHSIYWGARQTMVGIGELEDGDIIDYTVNKKGFTYALLSNDEDRFIPPMRGNFYDIVPFWVDLPTLSKVYTIDIPKNKEIQYEFYQGTCQSSSRLKGDRRVLSFKINNAIPYKREPNSVGFFDVAPKLMLSSTPEWKDKSLWFHNVNEDYGSFDAFGPAQKKVDELIKGKKTEMEKIAVLTHWVADNMRYSGLTMGEGEGYTLHNTEMNFTDRCGVCKDKAALLISMLRMAGLEAYPAMTMAGSRIESIPADHFNHCVAVVKLENGTYMPLDPTWVPFSRELWSSYEQQQNYLPGIPEGSDLCITPASAPENHYLKINAKTSLLENGTLKGEFTVRAEGVSDAAVRKPFLDSRVTEIKNSLENVLLRVSPRAKLLKVDYGKNPSNYQAGPIKMTMKFEIPDYVFEAEDGTLLYKPICGQLYQNVESYRRINLNLKTRKDGFKDSCSRLVELTEEISIPRGYNLLNENFSITEDSTPASFTGNLSSDGNNAHIYQNLSLRKRVYEASDWAGFRAAVKSQKDMANTFLIFTK